MKVIFDPIRRPYEVYLPEESYNADVGIDLRYYPDAELGTFLRCGETELFSCAFRMQLPSNHFGMICSRSGLARQGIIVTNAPGIIDPEYRGEIKVILSNINIGIEPKWIDIGDRIAQLIILPVTILENVVGKVSINTERGEQGFGSTGQ